VKGYRKNKSIIFQGQLYAVDSSYQQTVAVMQDAIGAKTITVV